MGFENHSNDFWMGSRQTLACLSFPKNFRNTRQPDGVVRSKACHSVEPVCFFEVTEQDKCGLPGPPKCPNLGQSMYMSVYIHICIPAMLGRRPSCSILESSRYTSNDIMDHCKDTHDFCGQRPFLSIFWRFR